MQRETPISDPAPAAGLSKAVTRWLELAYGSGLYEAFAVDGSRRIRFVNTALELACSRKREDILGRDIADIFPVYRRTSWAEHLDHALNGRHSFSGSCFLDPADTGNVTVSYAPLPGEMPGAIEGGLIVRHASYGRASPMEQLRETEDRFRAMANSSPVLLWMAGTDSLCTFFNQTWLTFTGRSMDEETGMGWAEGVHPEDLQSCVDTYMEAFNARKEFRMTYRLRRHDGEFRWILDTGVPRYSPRGEFLGYIGSCVDISERMEAETALHETLERLSRSNTELERFAYVASHDLQEPLLKVSSFSDLLSTDYGKTLDEEARSYLERIQQASKRMRTLIDDLLAYSRVRNTACVKEAVDMGDVVAEVLSDLDVRIQQLGATVHVAKGLPLIEGDAVQLRQLLQNLVSNALKFHRPGVKPVVHIGAVNSGTGATRAILIADNGIGIDARFFDQIFEPFKRLHSREYPEGSGIGLAICRRIVDNHDGRIEVKSELGVGTEFLVALPIGRPTESCESV
ncbi:MAG: PAS domain S-box protein [Planctomycetaceae bacterium]|nr:PAS domain S-box protein [Planctomycetaceae bacterium]